jgi:predicted nucleic-acid-binding protein
MRAVDTNVVVRLLARDDEAQTRAAETFIADGAWLSHVVLAESIWVLGSVYGVKINALANAVDMLLSHRSLVIQDPETVQAAVLRFRQTKGVSFSDCLVLESARRVGHLPLGTFDRALGALDGGKQVR